GNGFCLCRKVIQVALLAYSRNSIVESHSVNVKQKSFAAKAKAKISPESKPGEADEHRHTLRFAP
ncbi:MAG TPA: hypothetical protein VF630_09590, partial [Hymenobacter sp.]